MREGTQGAVNLPPLDPATSAPVDSNPDTPRTGHFQDVQEVTQVVRRWSPAELDTADPAPPGRAATPGPGQRTRRLAARTGPAARYVLARVRRSSGWAPVRTRCGEVRHSSLRGELADRRLIYVACVVVNCAGAGVRQHDGRFEMCEYLIQGFVTAVGAIDRDAFAPGVLHQPRSTGLDPRHSGPAGVGRRIIKLVVAGWVMPSMRTASSRSALGSGLRSQGAAFSMMM